MKKRSIGHRADPLIDSIDLMILRILKEEDSLSVLKLARVTNLPHKNKKPHLEKLIQAKIVYAFKKENSQKIDLRLNNNFLTFLPILKNISITKCYSIKLK